MVAGGVTRVRQKTMDMTKPMSSVIYHKISWISKVRLNSLANQFSSAVQPEAAHILRKHAGTLPRLGAKRSRHHGLSQTTKSNGSFLLSACVHLSQANLLTLLSYFSLISAYVCLLSSLSNFSCPSITPVILFSKKVCYLRNVGDAMSGYLEPGCLSPDWVDVGLDLGEVDNPVPS